MQAGTQQQTLQQTYIVGDAIKELIQTLDFAGLPGTRLLFSARTVVVVVIVGVGKIGIRDVFVIDKRLRTPPCRRL